MVRQRPCGRCADRRRAAPACRRDGSGRHGGAGHGCRPGRIARRRRRRHCGPLAAAGTDLVSHPSVGGVPVRRHGRGREPRYHRLPISHQGSADALRAGITTIRCVHEQNRADLLLRTAVQRGWFAAPRILGAGRAISTREGHGQGAACAYATGEQEFYEAALAELAAGADHVKIFINGGLAGAREHYARPEMTDGEIRGAASARLLSSITRTSSRTPAKRSRSARRPSSGSALLRACLPSRRPDRGAARAARHLPRHRPRASPARNRGCAPGDSLEHSIQNALNAADDHLASIQHAIRALRSRSSTAPTIRPATWSMGCRMGGPRGSADGRGGLVAPLLSLQSVSVNAARLLGIDDLVATDSARLWGRLRRCWRESARRHRRAAHQISLRWCKAWTAVRADAT